jgi:hypothetical protein
VVGSADSSRYSRKPTGPFMTPTSVIKQNHKDNWRMVGYRLVHRVRFPAEARGFLVSITSRSTLGPTQPPLRWVPGVLLTRLSGGRMKITTYLNLVPRFRMRGALPPRPYMSPLRGVVTCPLRTGFIMKCAEFQITRSIPERVFVVVFSPSM